MPPRNVFRHGGTRRRHSTRPTARSPPGPAQPPQHSPLRSTRHRGGSRPGTACRSSPLEWCRCYPLEQQTESCHHLWGHHTAPPAGRAPILPGFHPNPFCSPKTQLLPPCLFYGYLPQPGTSWAPSCPLLAFPTCQPDASSLKCPLSLQPRGTSPLVPLCGHFGAVGRGRGEPPSSAPLPTPRPAGRCLFLQMLNSAPLLSARVKTWGKEGREVARVPKHAGSQL